jgi:hypothetical protein
MELQNAATWRVVDGNALACVGDGSPGFLRFREGQSVALIGPDGNQLSADFLTNGSIQKSLFDDLETNICAFNARFTNVPDVATYRVQEPNGTITTLSWSLQRLKDDDWTIGISY